MNTAGTAKTSGSSLKGLELSEQYYHELVEPAIRESCPEALPHLAAGLVGEGSDCFGFDDEISKDHDWGPRVCLWLQDAAYERFFHVLSSTLASLPDTFRGERFSMRTPEAAGRQGVLRTGDFYRSFTGDPEGPRTLRDWLSLPESHLAACTNGKVFYDGPGRFSLIRHHILNGCPEDVRRKRLAARIALMAQSGQYNYLRCLKHGEPVAAFLALSEFTKHGLAAVYFLNRRYMPFYKWAHRGIRELPAYLVACLQVFKDFLSHVDMSSVLKIKPRIKRSDRDLYLAGISVRIAVGIDIYPRVKSRQHGNRHYNSQRKKAPA